MDQEYARIAQLQKRIAQLDKIADERWNICARAAYMEMPIDTSVVRQRQSYKQKVVITDGNITQEQLDDLMTTTQAAAFIGVTLKTFYNYIKKGKVVVRSHNTGHLKFSRSEMQPLKEARKELGLIGIAKRYILQGKEIANA